MKQNDFIITTDSGCEMNYEMCKKYNVIPLFMNYMKKTYHHLFFW